MKRIVNTVFVVIAALVIVGGAFVGGVYIGKSDSPKAIEIGKLLAATTEISIAPQVDMISFWKTWNIINEKYVPTGAATSSPITDEQKVFGTIEGLVASLGDQYSFFLPP